MVEDKSKLKAEVGTYKVTFGTEKGTSVTVECEVNDNAHEDKTTNEIISANNFKIIKGKVKSLSDSKLIELAHATATSTIDGRELEVKVQDRSQLQPKPGTYKIIFATERNTIITVKCTVYKYGIIQQDSEYILGSRKTIFFEADINFKDFIHKVVIKGNGYEKEISENIDYIATQGSTIITLQVSYLESLAVGDYSIDIYANDDIATTKFKVKNAAKKRVKGTKTGDNYLHLYLLSLTLISFAGMTISRKKKKR